MSKTTQNFNAEIKQLLDIVIHSLYSQKEIFLRELISNASDAIDKLRFQAVTQPSLLPENWQPAIRLEANKEARTLKIIDNGIGMTEEEVTDFIGTIAKSGAKKFAQMNHELKERPDLIGQFGVGFYSAFMVADQVTLQTQKAGTTEGAVWESTGDGTYTIETSQRPEGTGTTITLHLKKFTGDEAVADFTDEWQLKSLVKKYSDFIAHPILLAGEKGDETLNSQKALWLKPAHEVTAEEHNEFYQHLTHDFHPPLKTIHFRAEGTMEFHALLYVPASKPWNYETRDMEFGLNLYINRVFITASCKDLLPTYLRFMKGLIDSSDLSLNVSREILQQDRQVMQIKKSLTSKVLSSLKDFFTQDRTGYENFWSEFGPTLKEGVPSDKGNLEKIQDLLLFHSTQGDKMTSLDEYVQRMKPDQKSIYFVTGDSLAQVSNSPYLEKLKEKNLEVLLLVDTVDEWLTNALPKFKEKALQSITSEGLDLDSPEDKTAKEEEKKKATVELAPVIEIMKQALAEQVKDVVISDRLTQTPVCLVSAATDPSAHLQKILMRMGQGEQAVNKRVLEINPAHPVFKKMSEAPAETQKKWAELLYSQALLNEGSALADPFKFSRQVADLMVQSVH
jgi:molecular chaperone HtpG